MATAVLEQEKEKILEHFGSACLDSNGNIDRKALGRIVFGKAEELAFLENIVHPAVNKIVEKWANKPDGRIGVIHAALLHRLTVFDTFSFIFIVRAPLLTRLFRAKKRDDLSFRQLIKRFRNQKEFISQYLSGNADIHIVNNRGCFALCSRQRSLEDRIDEVLSKLG